MSDLRLILFGAPRIELDGRLVQVERQKEIALLAYLAVTQQPHRRDLLAALLWPESNQDAPGQVSAVSSIAANRSPTQMSRELRRYPRLA